MSMNLPPIILHMTEHNGKLINDLGPEEFTRRLLEQLDHGIDHGIEDVGLLPAPYSRN